MFGSAVECLPLRLEAAGTILARIGRKLIEDNDLSDKVKRSVMVKDFVAEWIGGLA